jgi:hypothetical protein
MGSIPKAAEWTSCERRAVDLVRTTTLPSSAWRSKRGIE